MGLVLYLIPSAWGMRVHSTAPDPDHEFDMDERALVLVLTTIGDPAS